uniref:Uncharacterized protein n=1 Tax=Rhizophora mucronata TaxID=61149 RepID=A0A2P2QT47_RHIMU
MPIRTLRLSTQRVTWRKSL